MEVSMKLGRPKPLLVLTPEQRAQLESLASSRSLPHGLVTRVRIILLSAQGLTNRSIAGRLRWTEATVGKWRRRFLVHGISGLHDEWRPGRPRSISDERMASLIRRTLQTKPRDGTHWSVRQMAAQSRLAKSTAHRIWQALGEQPHRQRSFKRAQPLLPLGLGYVEGVTHDYRRHGTTTLFAALNTASGTVLSQCRRRHRHQEYLDFLRQIDGNVPAGLDVHLIVDNYATHKHPRVKRWLATRPRFHVHFTPTHASWLNQVEIWCNLITRRAIRRGTFRRVKHLVASIDLFVRRYNTKAQPFLWTATADSILEKLRRLCERISGTRY